LRSICIPGICPDVYELL